MKQLSYWFYTEDIPERTSEYEKLFSSLKCEDITDDEVWEIVRTYPHPPHLGNIYLYLLFARIQAALAVSHPDVKVDYFINALDSHLYMNGEEIFSEEDAWRILLSRLTREARINASEDFPPPYGPVHVKALC